MSQGDLLGNSSAVFSPCRTWRYSLTRRWGAGPPVMVVGLNPSTADENTDDPTIRRCKRFVSDWGFNALVMANLFAYRSTDPTGLLTADDPIGPENDQYLHDLASEAALVIPAWGVHGALGDRGAHVLGLLIIAGRVGVLGLTKDGFPRHPLYMPASSVPLDPTTMEPLDLEVFHGSA